MQVTISEQHKDLVQTNVEGFNSPARDARDYPATQAELAKLQHLLIPASIGPCFIHRSVVGALLLQRNQPWPLKLGLCGLHTALSLFGQQLIQA